MHSSFEWLRVIRNFAISRGIWQSIDPNLAERSDDDAFQLDKPLDSSLYRGHIAKLLRKEEKDLTSDNVNLGLDIMHKRRRARRFKSHADMMIRIWMQKSVGRGLFHLTMIEFSHTPTTLQILKSLKTCCNMLPNNDSFNERLSRKWPPME